MVCEGESAAFNAAVEAYEKALVNLQIAQSKLVAAWWAWSITIVAIWGCFFKCGTLRGCAGCYATAVAAEQAAEANLESANMALGLAETTVEEAETLYQKALEVQCECLRTEGLVSPDSPSPEEILEEVDSVNQLIEDLEEALEELEAEGEEVESGLTELEALMEEEEAEAEDDAVLIG